MKRVIKSCYVGFRAQPDERRKLEIVARSAGVSISEILRMLVRHAPVDVEGAGKGESLENIDTLAQQIIRQPVP